jgi:hypothetical protein
MINRTSRIRVAKEYCNQVTHCNARSSWCLNRVIELDGVCEKTVNANSPPVVRSYAVGNFIRRVPILAILGPLCLTRNIVGTLGLIKEDTPAVSIPQCLKPLEMLNE